MRKDSAGVTQLRSQGDNSRKAFDKAKILNNQFSSVFSQEPIGSMQDNGPSTFTSMPQIEISTPGVKKLLDNLKLHTASCPDSILPMVLNTPSLIDITSKLLELTSILF